MTPMRLLADTTALFLTFFAFASCAAREPQRSGNGDRTSTAQARAPATPTALLPRSEAAATERWFTASVCARCHGSDPRSLRAPDGEDVAPNAGWAASMMGLSARDPYFLAALTRELWKRPKAKSQLERMCLGCHAPMGVRESALRGGHLSLMGLLRERNAVASLGRDGVSCLVCHSIEADGLGQPQSFTGGFSVASSRIAFGPRKDPLDEAMRQMVHTEARYGPHLSESSMCGSCHTVVLAPMRDDGTPDGPSYVEQGTYLEWRNSSFRTEAPSGATPTSCIECHMVPRSGRLASQVALASRPPNGLPLRDGVRAHTLAGGNAYLLKVLAQDPAAVGIQLTAAQLLEGADAATRMLRSAAQLRIVAATHSERRLRAGVTVVNRSGHKLPTGYPFRRMWLRWRLRSSDGLELASAGQNANDAMLDHSGQQFSLHCDGVTRADQTPVWEAIPVDRAGQLTHVVAETVGFGKDDRILPAGWELGARADGISPVGVGEDRDFGPGSDTVWFDLEAPPGAYLELELVYQSIPRQTLDSYHGVPGEAPDAFVRLTAPVAPEPTVMASASTRP